jgi:hypothetical protein
MGNIQMTDYTPSDLPRLIVDSIRRIRIPNSLKHNRQLIGVTFGGRRVVLKTWYTLWGSYSARVPKGIDLTEYITLSVEELGK